MTIDAKTIAELRALERNGSLVNSLLDEIERLQRVEKAVATLRTAWATFLSSDSANIDDLAAAVSLCCRAAQAKAEDARLRGESTKPKRPASSG